jgi:alkyl hydroperoxide reductase subunit AhpF
MPYILLNEELINQIQDMFDSQLEHPVEILYFSKQDRCDTCEDTHQLLEEVTSLSDKLHLSIHNLEENPELAQQYQVVLAPGLVITGLENDKLLDFGVHFSGIPSGSEFGSLIHAIIMVSKRDSGLKPEIRKELKDLSIPINLKVFVTPT